MVFKAVELALQVTIFFLLCLQQRTLFQTQFHLEVALKRVGPHSGHFETISEAKLNDAFPFLILVQMT